jgi:5-methylcytosine-specific restriction endonuclease McrA
MNKLTYSEKLKSPLWQRKRLEIFPAGQFYQCQSCGNAQTDLSLHVHHLKYFANLEPWEYEDHYFVTYCEKCHNTEHLIGDTIRQSLVEIASENSLYIHLVAQLCILVEKHPAFVPQLKEFLNNAMIDYLKSVPTK